MNISHQGIGTGCGLTFSLEASLKVAVGNQANFTAYNKLAMRTAIPGQAALCDAGHKAIGSFIDCSPRGDSASVETQGFEWVSYSGTAPAVGSFVTPAAAGNVAIIAAGQGIDKVPTDVEAHAGCWQVDQLDTTNKLVLICF